MCLWTRGYPYESEMLASSSHYCRFLCSHDHFSVQQEFEQAPPSPVTDIWYNIISLYYIFKISMLLSGLRVDLSNGSSIICPWFSCQKGVLPLKFMVFQSSIQKIIWKSCRNSLKSRLKHQRLRYEGKTHTKKSHVVCTNTLHRIACMSEKTAEVFCFFSFSLCSVLTETAMVDKLLAHSWEQA